MIKAILFDFDGVLTTDATDLQSICNYICKKTGLGAEAFKKGTQELSCISYLFC